ncbi:MAG: NAD(P)H-hydrate dehydratase [Gemmataceae bacterium]|nr:NAD(P)H-hydrate dehydratase [Gemmata sp.]MDW8198547.1 NAD(P)H-hydrate dehydratase [Gemmataceae bacterium]
MSSRTRIRELPQLLPRAREGHKGTYGTVLVIAGSRGMSGAAILCGRAALRSGAGLVQVACPVEVQPIVATAYPGYTTFGIRQHTDGSYGDGTVEELLDRIREVDVVALGPGLGREPATVAFVQRLIVAVTDKPIVVDADGLFAISPFRDEFARSSPWVLTPHPGEFARLTGRPAPFHDTEREEQTSQFAQRCGGVVLLKGAGTVVADGSRWYRNDTGNPGMATGGSGDVLTGVIAALIGQGLPCFDAAVLGAWIHGRAGDLAAQELSQTALTATDLLDYLPKVFRELEQSWSSPGGQNPTDPPLS